MEQTLVIIKPDALQRQIVGRIISRLEDKCLKLVGMKMIQMDLPKAQQMYAEHEGKEFYNRLVKFMTVGPVVALVLEGLSAVAVTRAMIGPTFGPNAPAGTIRGDFGLSRRYNIIHASDSAAASQREIPIFFRDDEIVHYSLANENWIYDMNTGRPI